MSAESQTIQLTKHDFSAITDVSSWAYETLSNIYGPDLAAAQLSLEHEAYTLGEDHFKKVLERSIDPEFNT